jgi:hypothetical protein
MASQLKVDTITGVTTAGSISVTGEGNSTTTNLQQGLAKAWVYAEADAVRTNSFNMSSSTDHADGDFSYGLTAAFSAVTYSQSGMVRTGARSKILTRNSDRSTSSLIAVEVGNTSDAAQNYDHDVQAQGDLA